MEEQNLQNDVRWDKFEKAQRRGKIMGGLLIVAIGSLFLARELGMDIPFWVFSWKMLLIGLGLIIAIKHKFLHPGWIVLIGVGGAFLLTDLYPEMNIKPILWPILIILLGLFIIFKPRRRKYWSDHKHWQEKWRHKHHMHHLHEYRDYVEKYEERENNKEDYIDSTVIMAGVKRTVTSKKFKGGDIVNIFGGTEVNLMQADFEDKIDLEVTQVFGGTKLIIPANWEIRSELVTMFGSVEDKRSFQANVGAEPGKLVVLTGTTIFGGIEIRN